MSEATSPQLAVNHRPKRSKRFADLIISSSFEFENRWAFTDEIVDYDAIERWSDRRLQMNNSNLKRIKLYGLSAKSITGLLRNLCENENRSQLEHLEIDKLEIVQGNKFHPDHVFNDLKVLSINSTKIVDDRGEEAPGCLGVLAFNAPSLSTVYLGSNSIDFVQFVSYQSITTLGFGFGCHASANLLQYENLETLQCDELQECNLNGILEFASGAKGRLASLHCNLSRLESTEYRPALSRWQMFERVYERLASEFRNGRIRPSLSIYFHGVRLDFDNKFTTYGFGANLASLQHRHLLHPGGVGMPCLSVQRANYPGAVFDLYDRLKPGQGEPAPPDERHFGFWRFSCLYPNIRMLVLDNSADSKASVQPAAFVRFLENCRALTCLWLKHSKLETTFFNRMARLPSLAKLTHFTLLEPNGAARERIHFEFLNRFSCLRHFCTNMAPREVMLDLIEMQRVDATFTFQFWIQSKKSEIANNDWHCVGVRRLANAAQATYQLAVERRNLDRPNFRRELFRRNVSQHEMRKALDAPEIWNAIAHWQDGLPLYRPL